LQSLFASGQEHAPILISRAAEDDDWTASVERAVAERMGDRARWIADQIRPELAHGPLAMLLIGGAGFGKSTAARQLARHCTNGSSLVLDAAAASEVQAWTVAAGMRPSALIVEDIDHAIRSGASPAMLLGQFERARSYANLIVLTANELPESARGLVADDDKKKTAPKQDPLTRTGRVDYIFDVDELDHALAGEIGLELPADVLAKAIERGFSASDMTRLAIRWRAHPDRRDHTAACVLDDAVSPRASFDRMVAP